MRLKYGWHRNPLSKNYSCLVFFWHPVFQQIVPCRKNFQQFQPFDLLSSKSLDWSVIVNFTVNKQIPDHLFFYLYLRQM